MIENQRAYQLIYSKTHSKALGKVVGLCGKMVGICTCELSARFGKKQKISLQIEETRAQMQEIYKKPSSDEMFLSMPSADPNVDLSVIIPAYNAEKYIVSCIDSILNQQTSYRVEIIVVNDQSTDGTKRCLEQYRSCEQVKIIELENGGSAARARNEGLRYASGEYLLFVDSDDMLVSGTIHTLMSAAAETGAEIIQGGWQYMDEAGILGNMQLYAEKTYMGNQQLDRFDLPGMPWGKLYKRELFEEIRFPSNYTCFEDGIIHFLAFRKAKTVASVKETVYYWRKNSAGITQTSQNQPKAIQSYWIVEEMIQMNQKLGLPHDEMFAICVIAQLSNFCYVNIRGLDREIQEKVFALCCALYSRCQISTKEMKMPYAIRLGERALKEKRFDLWITQGRYYQLIR